MHTLNSFHSWWVGGGESVVTVSQEAPAPIRIDIRCYSLLEVLVLVPKKQKLQMQTNSLQQK